MLHNQLNSSVASIHHSENLTFLASHNGRISRSEVLATMPRGSGSLP